MRVRSHIALLVAVVLVPVVLFSALVLHFLIDAERKASLRSMQELARATVLIMDQELTVAMAAAQSLGTSPSLARGDFAEFYQQAKNANAGRVTNVALIDEHGQQLFNTIAPYGTRISPPADVTQKRVKEVLESNRPAYSNLIKGSTTKKYVVAVELPVQINNGKRFLVDVWMFASHLNSLLPSRGIPTSWLISVFDRQGTTIARNMSADEYVGQPPKEKQINTILSGYEGISRGYIRGGIEVYGAWARSSVSGWTIAVGVPVKEIEQAAVRSVALTAIGFLIALVFAVSGAILFSRRLVSAIDTASYAANLLGQRKVPPLDHSRIDEMNQLQMSLYRAGSLLVESETARVRHLEEAEKARAAAEQAQATAEAQNKAKDQFLAMLGHELRNPLAAIASGVTVLNLPTTDPDRAAKVKSIIERQTTHLSHLVDELLDAHRILSGKITLAKAVVDLQSVVQSCGEAFEARGAFGQHQLRLDLSTAVIEADPTRLEQMVSNLVENALKYTPEGGAITVSVKSDGSQGIVSVADTGVGLPPELLSNVLDVFVQGKVINRSKGGLGIGLAVVNSLAQQHGATLVVESPGIGQGSTFSIRFPLASHVPADRHAPKTHSRVRTAKILVIEDNRDVREMLCAMLTEFGFEIVSAENGQNGLESAFANLPDVALVDIDLPDMSGYDVAHRLRNDPRSAKMQLIAVTGYGQSSDREKAIASGFDVHLRKPLVIDDLVAALEVFDVTTTT
jgi:signal transduction histidine kinase/ActR/RegA family two-component response regulator